MRDHYCKRRYTKITKISIRSSEKDNPVIDKNIEPNNVVGKCFIKEELKNEN